MMNTSTKELKDSADRFKMEDLKDVAIELLRMDEEGIEMTIADFIASGDATERQLEELQDRLEEVKKELANRSK